MNTNDKKIIGCSFDGLKDRFFVHGNNSPHGTDFYLADVVLPKHYGGNLLAGDIAERDRASSGFHWPPEAQVKDGNNLRRIPVPWAWRLFIDAEEKYGSGYTRWSIGGGISFNISKILTAHIVDKLGSEKENADKIVIAIPNDLNEFRQQELINDLISQGIGSRKEKPRLLWRPIAAALAWLDKVQFPKTISNEDFILIVHIGPDSVEFVTLRLREIVHGGKRYIVPVRETPHNKYSLCGCDWAAEFIGQEFDTNKPDEIWQCFTNFPETWKALAQQSWNKEELPRVWSRGDSWELWEPEESCKDRILQVESKTSTCLDNLTRKNYVHKRTASFSNSWKEFLQHGVQKALDDRVHGSLCGMILSGPLTSANPIVWLQGIKEKLESRGLSVNIFDKARLNGVWAPGFDEDIVSEGASIYGARISRNEPTYFDIVPPLDTWAERDGIARWEPLLKRSIQGKIEIAGNIPLEIEHKRCFSLKRDSKRLEVFLRKGDSKEYKKATFSFPYAPKEDMPLCIKIRVASANGLAQVELIPENKEFLGGQRVFMDYSRMTETNEVPRLRLGFPPVTDFDVDTKDYRINHVYSFKKIYEDFFATDIIDPGYEECIHKLRYEIHKLTLWKNNSYRVVNKDGKTGTGKGQIIINEISKKMGSDFSRMLANEVKYADIIKKTLGASTWLFGGAPLEVINYLRRKLKDEIIIRNIQGIVGGAGRCFTEKDDIALLFSAGIRRVHKGFPIYWSRAIWNVLYLRECAPEAMERKDADLFVKCIVSKMEDCSNNKNFKMIFMQSVRTFLYLLRFRLKEQDFLSYESQSYRECFNKIINCLKKAQEYYVRQAQNYYHRIRNKRKNELAAEYMEEVKKYMHGVGGDIIKLERELFPEEESSP